MLRVEILVFLVVGKDVNLHIAEGLPTVLKVAVLPAVCFAAVILKDV